MSHRMPARSPRRAETLTSGAIDSILLHIPPAGSPKLALGSGGSGIRIAGGSMQPCSRDPTAFSVSGTRESRADERRHSRIGAVPIVSTSFGSR
jgi:hypothetical protein